MLPLNRNEPNDGDEGRCYYSDEERSVKTEKENVTQQRVREAERS